MYSNEQVPCRRGIPQTRLPEHRYQVLALLPRVVAQNEIYSSSPLLSSLAKGAVREVNVTGWVRHVLDHTWQSTY